MKTTIRLSALAGLAVAVTALIATPAAAAQPSNHGSAVFVQTDNTAANTVVVYDRSASGLLSQAGTYGTGGVGGVLTGSTVDHLASQGSLAYDRLHQLLYAVNAGSNTITVFTVHGDQLTRHQVISSGGTFPVSVTTHGDLVYVLNARDGGSVQGYLRIANTLIRIPAWHRSLGLDASLTPEFTHTPGQIAFTPDGTQLVVSTKGNTNAIDVYGIRGLGGPSATFTANVTAGAVPFGVAFDPAGHLVVANTGPSAIATYTIASDGTTTLIDQVATGQAATCWVTAAGSRFYTGNAGSASTTGFQGAGNGTLTDLGNTATDAGTVDGIASPDGRNLYVQTGAAGIVDEYTINGDGSLASIGSVTVPGAVGGEGIAAS